MPEFSLACGILLFVLQIVAVWKETRSIGERNSYGTEYVEIVIKYRGPAQLVSSGVGLRSVPAEMLETPGTR